MTAALRFDVDDNPLDIGVRFEEATSRVEGGMVVPIVVTIPYDNVVLVPRAETHEANVRLFVAVMDEVGNLSPVREMRVPFSLASDQLELARGKVFPYRLPLVLSAGRHRLAVGVRDDFAGAESVLTAGFTLSPP